MTTKIVECIRKTNLFNETEIVNINTKNYRLNKREPTSLSQ